MKLLETQRKQDEEIKHLNEDVLRMKDNLTSNILDEIEDRDCRKTNLRGDVVFAFGKKKSLFSDIICRH